MPLICYCDATPLGVYLRRMPYAASYIRHTPPAIILLLLSYYIIAIRYWFEDISQDIPGHKNKTGQTRYRYCHLAGRVFITTLFYIAITI